MSRSLPEQERPNTPRLSRGRFLRLGSGLLITAAGSALLPAGLPALAEGQDVVPVPAIPYFVNNTLGIHSEIVEKAQKNARFELQGDGIRSESYYTPGGTLEEKGISTAYGERKWDHLFFEGGLPSDLVALRTHTSFEQTPETAEWNINFPGNGIMELSHKYNPNGTRWLAREGNVASLRLKEPNLPLTITRVFATGGEIDFLQVISGSKPPTRVNVPKPMDGRLSYNRHFLS